jgi:hypothetical protein
MKVNLGKEKMRELRRSIRKAMPKPSEAHGKIGYKRDKSWKQKHWGNDDGN